MNRYVLIAGVVVLLSNALALMQAARNRWGEPEAVVELTERELQFNFTRESNSHRYGTLVWMHGGQRWLDHEKLIKLGFSPRVDEGVRRNRVAWVAIDVNAAPQEPPMRAEREHGYAPHAVPIDADRDPVQLRARQPNRNQVLILRATIHAYANSGKLTGSVASVITGTVSVSPDMARDLPTTTRVGEPRYTVRLAVGRNYEPYLVSIRRIDK